MTEQDRRFIRANAPRFAVREMADFLGVHARTVRNYCLENGIKAKPDRKGPGIVPDLPAPDPNWRYAWQEIKPLPEPELQKGRTYSLPWSECHSTVEKPFIYEGKSGGKHLFRHPAGWRTAFTGVELLEVLS